jgi:hypothetical protein
MLKRTLGYCLIALSLCGAAYPRVHRGSPRKNKIFAAKPNSVALENQAADAMGIPRYLTQDDVDLAVLSGELVPVQEISIDKRLPENRRYARPATVQFIAELNWDFFEAFGHFLVLDSAVRPASIQKRLLKWNHSAAPAYGPKASSHERGCTVDIGKKQSKQEHAWMLNRLLYYRALGRILVIEESRCWHIMVKGSVNAAAVLPLPIDFPMDITLE